MKIYDISLTLSPQSVRWVTAQPLELIERKRMSRGDTNNSSSIHTSVHAGTHVDAPFHFVPDGHHHRIVAAGNFHRAGARVRREAGYAYYRGGCGRGRIAR